MRRPWPCAPTARESRPHRTPLLKTTRPPRLSTETGGAATQQYIQVQGILEASPPVSKHSGRVRLRGSRISARRVKALVRLEQEWYDRGGRHWTVCRIHRKDRLVALEGPGSRPRYVSFSDLGKDYRPVIWP
jgi:hypothetical protein